MSKEHSMRKAATHAHRREAATTPLATFSEMFVKPLENEYTSIHGNKGRLLTSEPLERMRELAMSEDMPTASRTDAEELQKAVKLLLTKLKDRRHLPSLLMLKAAAAKLGRILSALKPRLVVRQRGMLCHPNKTYRGFKPRKQIDVKATRPRLRMKYIPSDAKLQEAVRNVVIHASNVSLTINAERGSNVTVYLSPGSASGGNESKTEIPGKPNEPETKRTRGKGKFGIRRRTGIANCPYVFMPDRCSIMFKPTGVKYTITARAAVHAVNRLTLALKNTKDGYAKFTGKDAGALRSACREFLDDCVEREGVSTGDGNHKFSGRARLIREPKSQK